MLPGMGTGTEPKENTATPKSKDFRVVNGKAEALFCHWKDAFALWRGWVGAVLQVRRNGQWVAASVIRGMDCL
jgi:hypothetical protein